MGTASLMKLVNSQLQVLHEQDFDKGVDEGLSRIAFSLPRDHVFRRLMNVLDTGVSSEKLDERFGSMIDEDAMDSVVISWKDLMQFSDYVSDDPEHLWGDLFPGRTVGLWNWLKYRFMLRAIERDYKAEPPAPQVWYRDVYSDLLGMVDRAIREKLFLLRVRY